MGSFYLSWETYVHYKGETVVEVGVDHEWGWGDVRNVEGFMAFAQTALQSFNRQYDLYIETLEFLRNQDVPPSVPVRKADVQEGDVLVPDVGKYLRVYADGHKYSIRVTDLNQPHKLQGSQIMDRVVVDRVTKKDVYVREPGNHKQRAWPIRNGYPGEHNLSGWRKVTQRRTLR
jgi:hypothetical protein